MMTRQSLTTTNHSTFNSKRFNSLWKRRRRIIKWENRVRGKRLRLKSKTQRKILTKMRSPKERRKRYKSSLL